MKQVSSSSGFLAKIHYTFLSLAAVIASCILISGCLQDHGTQTTNPAAKDRQSFQSKAADAEAIRAQQLQLVKVILTVTAPVKKMLRYDDKGLPHERFLLLLSNGTTVLVAHDTDMAPYVPIHAGDTVTVHGEFIWNEKGGLIHWTHHSDNPGHVGGYIDFNGKRYE